MARIPKRDLELSSKGVWVQFYDDIYVCVRPEDNADYLAEMLKRTAEKRSDFKHAIRKSLDGVDEAVAWARAHHIVVGWRNMQDDDGNDIPYSPEKAFEILTDPEYVEFRDWVLDVSRDAALFRKRQVEAAQGN